MKMLIDKDWLKKKAETEPNCDIAVGIKQDMVCMSCGDQITPENNGIAINFGEFYQCEACHFIEHGTNIYAMNLVF